LAVCGNTTTEDAAAKISLSASARDGPAGASSDRLHSRSARTAPRVLWIRILAVVSCHRVSSVCIMSVAPVEWTWWPGLPAAAGHCKPLWSLHRRRPWGRPSVSASASLAAQRGRSLIHGVTDALRIVIGKGPHASARLVHEPAPRRIEWIDHREQ